MRVIVCGDRNWDNKGSIRRALIEHGVTEVIEGEARGADTQGREVAEELGIPVIPVKADWKRYGRAAGPIRNREMLSYDPAAILAFHANLERSKGTKNMINQGEMAGVFVHLYTS
jgi:hypothetical protein